MTEGPPLSEGGSPHLGLVAEFNVSLDGEFPVSRRIQALRWTGSFTGPGPEWWSLWEECYKLGLDVWGSSLRLPVWA